MKRFDTSFYEGKSGAMSYLNNLIQEGALIEIKKVKKTRSNQTNRALHLYFTFISDTLREMGREFQYEGIKGMSLSTSYTPEIVKEFFWRPIQSTLFGTKSTTELTNSDLNEIIDVISKFFAEKGINVVFPSMESLIEKTE